jgi:hypothetical protein
MKVDGGCHCGYIAYEAEADPDKTVICHCTDCQTLSGSAFRTVAPTKEGTFKLRSGELKIYVKIGESGTARPQAFCPQCGTPIYSSVLGDGPKVHSLGVGTIRQRGQFAPQMQLWGRSAQPWVNDVAAIPKVDKQPVFSATGGFR